MSAGIRIGAVVIGRNEGERLRTCIESLDRSDVQIVYVDSGSTDGSRDVAAGFGASVVDLQPSGGFSAGRARNAGIERLLEIAPETPFAQVIDGDCELVSGWLEAALDTLQQESRIAVVCGRRRERFPDRSIYNRLCDIEWDGEPGDVDSCGGDAMLRISAFEAVGGYDPNLIAGEEPELCFRLRSCGWRIHRLDVEMTIHDAAMVRFSQWWQRNVRAGHACAEGAHLHGSSAERFRVREVCSIAFWSLLLPVALMSAMIDPAALVAVGAYPLQAFRIQQQHRVSQLPARIRWTYALSLIVGKFPALQGMIRFYWSRVVGRQSRLIEYK